MPKVTGPVKEAAGFAKEEAGEKLGNQAMADEGRDLRNRGRMEQGKDILLGTPGTGTTHPVDDLKSKLDNLGGGCAKSGCTCKKADCAQCQQFDRELGKPSTVPPPPLLHDIQAFNKSNLEHVETVDKTHPPLTGGLKKTASIEKTHQCQGVETKEGHKMKGDMEMEKAKDPHLPLTERVGHGFTAVAEKTKALFSSSGDKSTTTTK